MSNECMVSRWRDCVWNVADRTARYRPVFALGPLFSGSTRSRAPGEGKIFDLGPLFLVVRAKSWSKARIRQCDGTSGLS